MITHKRNKSFDNDIKRANDMKKNTITLRDIIIVIIAVFIIYALKTLFPILVIAGIYFYFRYKNKPRIEENPPRRPIQENNNFNLEAYRATLDDCEQYLRNERQIRQEADLRQFQGRTDVTKEELAQYMFEQRSWDGIHERRLQMEEIIKVCNLTMDDVEWVEQELKDYHLDDTVVHNKCCVVRSEEEQAVWQYQNEQETARLTMEIPQVEEDFQKNLAFHKEIGYSDDVIQDYQNDHEKLMNEYSESLRQCNYDLWLSMKGYVK